MASLIFRDRTVPLDGEAITNLGNNPYQKAVLDFCKEWISGKADFVIKTSGSTGTPKSITLTREQMLISALSTGKALDCRAGTRALLALNPEYIAGMMMLVRTMVLDWDLYVTAPAANPFRDLSQNELDFASLVPLQVSAALEESPEALEQCRTIIIGGAPISPGLELKLRKLKNKIYATFGMTETVTHIALRRVNGPDPSPEFRVLDGVQISLDDRGCLVVSGPVTGGLPVVTNDLVTLTGPDTFSWQGRIDRVINSGGVKVHPEAVEQQLFEAAPELPELFVTGEPDETLGHKVVLVVEGTRTEPLEQAIHKAMTTLPPYHRPRTVYFVEKFKRSPTGKVLREGSWG